MKISSNVDLLFGFEFFFFFSLSFSGIEATVRDQQLLTSTFPERQQLT